MAKNESKIIQNLIVQGDSLGLNRSWEMEMAISHKAIKSLAGENLFFPTKYDIATAMPSIKKSKNKIIVIFLWQ
ncbi:MAG: hypothetical protein WCV92_04110 [Candidatus Buchananbacteria bacterium]